MQPMARSWCAPSGGRHRIQCRGVWTDLHFKQVPLAAVWGADRARGTSGGRETGWEALGVTRTRAGMARPQGAEGRREETAEPVATKGTDANG